MTNILRKYNDSRVYIINEAGVMSKIILAFLFAIAIAVTSQIKIYLAFTPVPINLATFAVCASALTLGGFWSFISVTIFILAGTIGLPSTIAPHAFGATTGYLTGYALCALVLGKYTEKNNTNNMIKASIVLFISQIVIIHICGMIGLYIWSLSIGSPYTFVEVIMKGSLPFLIGDSIKAIVLSSIMTAILKNK
ncbi:biotin transporter BioY [Brachyspira sp.]|uniref:biotin transporter BioY n=1 Tax=Brachyspira sp. TaxID=1977261 RepID=UPI002629E214|nr:biotin transporter BioY [Brachyspira sp.]